MTKDNAKKSKPPTREQSPKGRSFCCSIFIYTFVFVSGVVVATILPDLAGHHFKQPYGKEYGALAEQVFQDLPKHLNKFRETVVLFAHAAVDRLWDLKTLAEERFVNTQEKKPEKPKTKTTTQRSTTQT